MPERIRLSRARGWRKPPNTVIVARPSKWGNPFPVPEPFTRAEAIGMFRELVLNREAFWVDPEGVRHRFTSGYADHPVPTLEQIRSELAGKNLACWCRLDEACHADVLLELANG
jgi:hypothetical protein